MLCRSECRSDCLLTRQQDSHRPTEKHANSPWRSLAKAVAVAWVKTVGARQTAWASAAAEAVQVPLPLAAAKAEAWARAPLSVQMAEASACSSKVPDLSCGTILSCSLRQVSSSGCSHRQQIAGMCGRTARPQARGLTAQVYTDVYTDVYMCSKASYRGPAVLPQMHVHSPCAQLEV